MRIEKRVLIKKSPTADTRTCGVSTVSKDQLLRSSKMHIQDVVRVTDEVVRKMVQQTKKHDWDKIANIDEFFTDFKNDFKTTGWFDNHKIVNRHHLKDDAGVRDDVNLIDVFEYVIDCCCAGMARSGNVYDLELSDEVLQKAFSNTAEMVKNLIDIEE